MIKKERVVTVEGLRDGKGSVEIHHILEGEDLMGHGTMFARVIVKPHSSIGWHQHVGNVCSIKVGQWHAMENNTDEDMEMIAFVMNE